MNTALTRALEAVEGGESPAATGYYKVLGSAKRDRELALEVAQRLALIDTKHFENKVRIRVPGWVGHVVLSTGSIAGVVALVTAGRLSGVIRDLVFLAGFGALLICTHSLTHVVIGRLMGMRFTHYFLGGPPPPRPGAKVDYETYLLATSKQRAVMHASGAVVTKLLPFAAMPVATATDVSRWVVYALVALGVVQIVTDILFSTKTSDWMKVKRELRVGASDRR